MNKTNTLRTLALIAGLLLATLIATSCGSVGPTEPPASDPTVGQVALDPSLTSHQILGVWDFVIEPNVGIVDAVMRRTVEGHYNITQVALSPQSCPGCIAFQFGNLNAGGQQDAIVTLNNKYVGKIPGYDIKGIILADTSVDPTPPYQSPWNLLNADDYTNIGAMSVGAGTRNPFKAFCPSDSMRKLAVGQSSVLTFKLMFPPPPVDWSQITVGWMLDACETNCSEPYAIDNQAIAGGIIPILGEPAQVSLNARDHQGDTASVMVNAASIGGGGGGGGGAVALSKGSGDLWSGKLTASDDTAPGQYTMEITASDSIEKNIKIFDNLTANVGITAEQAAMYDKLHGIIDDWDPELFDCVADELAKNLGSSGTSIDTPLEDFITDVSSLIAAGDTGDILTWKCLKRTKTFVADLGTLGIKTTMSALIDALRDALDACLNGHQGWGGTDHALNAGACSLDIGVIGGGALQGQILFTAGSPNCNQIWIYKSDYSSCVLYKSLVNLDPANPIFQPWPVRRLDAANDGAFSWANDNTDYYQDPAHGNIPIRISKIWCTDDNIPSFHPVPIDDSRIFPMPVPPPMSSFTPADVCDDFDLLQYALVVDPTMMVPPHVWGHMGANQGKDYTKLDDRYSATFKPAQIGPGDGQIEPGVGDIAGIDVWNKTSTTAWLYIAENGGQRAVEVFQLTDLGKGFGVDGLIWQYTIHFSNKPLDMELLPTNADYEKNPTCPTIAVLMQSNDGTGYISLHRADNGALIETVGTPLVGCFTSAPAYLDVNDATCEIHVTQQGPKVTVFSLVNLPGK
jgi:hypothetical protein